MKATKSEPDGDFWVTPLEYSSDQVKEYVRNRLTNGHGFAMVLSREAIRSSETEMKMYQEYSAARDRGATSAEIDTIVGSYPPDAEEWSVEYWLDSPLPEGHEPGKLSLEGKISNLWRNFSTDKKSLVEWTDTGMVATFYAEEGALKFARDVSQLLKAALNRNVKEKAVYPVDSGTMTGTFTGWLREKVKKPSDLWDPAPKADGIWVYGSTVTKYNEETGSSLSFSGLCAALDRKPQVKDGRKRVLVTRVA
ncbi:MAG TPA: hypothetical protein VEO96_08565 [Thermoplasmata archaeon]|nr:hypothetical protein [Thermoplasmata archaeon]